MVKSLEINRYRKFDNITLNFSKGINAISGTNGTCKTSLLHLISNSFQSVNSKCSWVRDAKCLSIISAINTAVNPKVESLTRGDKQYNDPARGVVGSLFTVDYYIRTPLEFRRHNSKVTSRYAVKPKYQIGSGDTLPFCPVLYLGLSRLVPYGEYNNDEAIVGVQKQLPNEYQDEISRLYKQFTGISIKYGNAQRMGDIKTRAEFDADIEGIDSNTVSAGEDNLFILLTALESLKYYYDSIVSNNPVESILLIDELDATLHPSFQIKFLKLLAQYADEYKIQIVFTTHSLTLMEEVLKYKYNILYLLDNETNVFLMEDPDIYKIKMHLQELTEVDIYKDRVIPVFTEDAEGRFILEHLISYFESTRTADFCNVRRFLHFVSAKVSADVLTAIFSDGKLLQMTMRSICILDGDHISDLSKCIVALPGKNAPEQFLAEYATELYVKNDPFWMDQAIVSRGYGKNTYRVFKQEIDDFEESVRVMQANQESTKGKRREFYKEFFKKYENFYDVLLKHWLHNPGKKAEVDKFYNEFRAVFKKVAPYNEIDSKLWK